MSAYYGSRRHVHPGGDVVTASTRRLLAREAAARGVSVARLREVARERLAGAVAAQGKDPLE